MNVEIPGWLRRVPMADCRRCTLPIRFVRLDTGNALPVDPAPNAKGNVCARLVGGRLHGYVISQEHGADVMFTRFMPHFATCDEAKRKTDAEDAAARPTLF